MYEIKSSLEAKKRMEENVPRGPFHVTPLTVKKAKGARIWDLDGNEYIDFAGGISCVNAGHCPPEVAAAIRDQADKCIHAGFNVVSYEPYVELAEKLNSIVPGRGKQKTLFFNSGAEAVENTVKIARYFTRRPGIICFEHGFHGRTLLGMSLTSKSRPYSFGFGPLAPHIYRVDHPASPSWKERGPEETWEHIFQTVVKPEEVAAVIIEPEVGEGGFIPCPAEAMLLLREVCDRHGIALIADEVQTGFCRTGKMFAMEHFGVAADLTALGKSLASGLPLSAVTGRQEMMDAPHVGGLGGTFGGNPVACRAALATIELCEKLKLAERAKEIGGKTRNFFSRLKSGHACISEIRGLGAMIGVEFVKPDGEPDAEKLSALIKACTAGGLIIMSCGTHSNVLRTMMPLVITDEELEKAFSIIEECLARVDPFAAPSPAQD